MSKFKLTNPLFRQLFLFLSVGVLCYFISLILLMFCVEIASIEVNLANLISSVIYIFICYLLNAKFVFKEGR
ncbi:GtrA family protein [Pricia antarctica]|uniref:GtrA family protein n=1 Tax=Pricia antarctica TaxID=641691 RepID=UPI000B839BBE